MSFLDCGRLNNPFESFAEVLVEEAPTMMRMIGVRDKFGESGSPMDIMDKMGLTSENIASKLEELLSK